MQFREKGVGSGEPDICSPGGRKPDIRDTDNRNFCRGYGWQRCGQADTSTSQLPGASTASAVQDIRGIRTKGRGKLQFEHYDSATLFKSSAELGALLDGNIDIGFIQLGYFYDNGALWANMFDIAFLYDDVDDMMQVLDTQGEVGKWVQDQIWDEFHVK